jgi:hypothetical protein
MGARIAAWLVTGTPGHLAAGLADWVSLLWQLGRGRLRRP